MSEAKFPQRVPIKVLGRMGVLQAEMVRLTILEILGLQPDGDQNHTTQCKGAYLSLTFWVTLPDEGSERLLREAIHKLPGVLMQL